ncbi:expressed protein [Arabidopsis lyrata subsp. lyrata]|uniref:Expressed protein n=1 Tax=Arabidopsis lyrata subsp. lyrata TaxID=81972 RepID=D7LHS9_ARALL|nr:expressed protein [Arabidopsis lyrata subsp. lyrata]
MEAIGKTNFESPSNNKKKYRRRRVQRFTREKLPRNTDNGGDDDESIGRSGRYV